MQKTSWPCQRLLAATLLHTYPLNFSLKLSRQGTAFSCLVGIHGKIAEYQPVPELFGCFFHRKEMYHLFLLSFPLAPVNGKVNICLRIYCAVTHILGRNKIKSFLHLIFSAQFFLGFIPIRSLSPALTEVFPCFLTKPGHWSLCFLCRGHTGCIFMSSQQHKLLGNLPGS